MESGLNQELVSRACLSLTEHREGWRLPDHSHHVAGKGHLLPGQGYVRFRTCQSPPLGEGSGDCDECGKSAYSLLCLYLLS